LLVDTLAVAARLASGACVVARATVGLVLCEVVAPLVAFAEAALALALLAAAARPVAAVLILVAFFADFLAG
jgi:hypothetical protein